jgi:hypothetical protein
MGRSRGATITMDDDDPDCAEVEKRELLLLDPAVRADPRRVRALLHPDFVEFGASGRIWDAEGIAVSLAADSAPGQAAPDQGTIEWAAPDKGSRDESAVALPAVNLRPMSLCAEIVLLTYRIDDSERPSLRSSVWLRAADGEWLLRFHQGTLVHSTS